MALTDYLFYAVMGICVVFVALILVMLVIKIIGSIPEGKTKPEDGPHSPAQVVAAVAEESAEKAPGSAGDIKLYDTDPRDAALIMAIVADELKKPLNELRFISIKEVK